MRAQSKEELRLTSPHLLQKSKGTFFILAERKVERIFSEFVPYPWENKSGRICNSKRGTAVATKI
jgi:hypothetical protein